MSSFENHTHDEHGVRQAENDRGRALETDDFDTLKKLISRDIVHTHSRGNVDDFDSFFHHIQNRIEFVECTRGDLDVRMIDKVAIMTGPMQNIVRLRGESEDIHVSAQVTQVWEWLGDQWLLRAFQATPVQQGH